MKVFRGTKEIFFHSFRNEDDNDGDDDDSGGAHWFFSYIESRQNLQ